eukprot:CAMPEP_0204521794 /NCGR_PEP_ID=MMETSP0661-20131031/5974_1 /ASSEMBLY_ACC=CAM_ASM_000606 /TAXON_ID=109239 /ORGANISM="Alexandrium margalefi, Strain AMGDE01CS-322" /LENGTH=349 /DNA_ID=CAMNT_0051527413 /DNA_START=50 /DNA_END=1098 /DNA_ORIENTATION=+
MASRFRKALKAAWKRSSGTAAGGTCWDPTRAASSIGGSHAGGASSPDSQPGFASRPRLAAENVRADLREGASARSRPPQEADAQLQRPRVHGLPVKRVHGAHKLLLALPAPALAGRGGRDPAPDPKLHLHEEDLRGQNGVLPGGAVRSAAGTQAAGVLQRRAHAGQGPHVLVQGLEGQAAGMLQDVVAAFLRQVPCVIEQRELLSPYLGKLLQAAGQVADELVEEVQQVEEPVVHQQGHARLAQPQQDPSCRRQRPPSLRVCLAARRRQAHVLLAALEERVEVEAVLAQEPQGLQVGGEDLAVPRPQVELVRAELPSLAVLLPAEAAEAELERQEAGHALRAAPEVLVE